MHFLTIPRSVGWAFAALALLVAGCGEDPPASDSNRTGDPARPEKKADDEAAPEAGESLAQIEPPAPEPADEVVEDVPEEDEELSAAIAALKKRADEGEAQAQFDLADKLAHGTGVTKDLEEAARYMRMAAEQGRADAQYSMGMKHETGMGVPKNKAEAERWYRLAIESQKNN